MDTKTQLTSSPRSLRWKRPTGYYHTSVCGRFTIYKSSNDRRRPQWKIFENGVGVRDIAFSMIHAKEVANEWANKKD